MPTHKTRLGLIDLEQITLTEWRAEAKTLKVNGKPCTLDPLHITLSQHSWDMNTWNRLHRHDGGRITTRGREKVEDTLRGLIETQVGDLTIVQRARWEITHKRLLRDLVQLQERTTDLQEHIRKAACQIRAHSLPGAQGEVARVLTREGWDKGPDELEEMVQILAG